MEVDPEQIKRTMKKETYAWPLMTASRATRSSGTSKLALVISVALLATILFVAAPIGAQPCLQVAAQSTTCGPSGDVISSFELTNLAGLTVHSAIFSGEVLLPSGSTTMVDPVSILFDPPLADGASQTIAITLSGAPPGDIVEIPFALLHQDIDGNITECCNEVLTVVIPDSCGLPTFIRGDANLDASLNIADPISVLAHLFSGGTVLCQSAADGNDDGIVNIADPVSLLGWIFGGTLPPPPIPFPNCGFDPTPDALDCLEYLSCP